jgi:predicted metal-binding membrane protein
MTATTRTTALAATLGVPIAAWLLAMQQMRGMDMGTGTELGSLGFFIGTWVPMMAAMMLPGALPALVRSTQAATLFAGSYLAIWSVVGLVVYALYQPHTRPAAGALVVAAAIYEITPFKRECRRRCRDATRSGLQFGVWCIGSSIGLMLVLLALGVMSVVWMSVVAAVVAAQKLIPPNRAIDISVALGLLALGLVVAL